MHTHCCKLNFPTCNVRAPRYFICVICRSFAVRRIRDGFRANKSLVDAGDIKTAYDKAVNSYDLLQRQVRSYLNIFSVVIALDILFTKWIPNWHGYLKLISQYAPAQ